MSIVLLIYTFYDQLNTVKSRLDCPIYLQPHHQLNKCRHRQGIANVVFVLD